MKKSALVVSIMLLLGAAVPGYSQFVDCTNGLLCMPSTEFDDKDSFKITNLMLNREYLPKSGWDYNTFSYGFSVTYWKRLEIAYVLTMFVGKWSPNYENLSYRGKIMFNQDRHFSARVLVLAEGDFGLDWLPALAVGVSDPVTGSGGDYIEGNIGENTNGYFNRTYAVLSKTFKTEWGPVQGLASYQYSVRGDGIPKGVQCGVTWDPVWLNKEGSFLSSFRTIVEWDARKLNCGIQAGIWGDRFEFMAMLFGMKYPMVGARFRVSLSH